MTEALKHAAERVALLATMRAVGIAELEPATLTEALIRFEMYRHLNGPVRYTMAGPIELDRALAARYFGLKTNGPHLTKAEFHFKLVDDLREAAKRVVSNPVLDPV